jgi:hypothetical protein
MLVLDSPRFGSFSSSVPAELAMDRTEDSTNASAERGPNILSPEKSNTELNHYPQIQLNCIVLHANVLGSNRFPMTFSAHSKTVELMTYSEYRLDKKNGLHFKRLLYCEI